nr:hypothetical protein Iba_chr01fCG8560 [Ipomoea batatas]GMC86382.1 hypothetical protein Iba_chr04dCG10410 [Ipomoea batatas]GMD21722.1 hypothetical protein Iba_chr08aCG3980 [Ipomoea batatas]
MEYGPMQTTRDIGEPSCKRPDRRLDRQQQGSEAGLPEGVRTAAATSDAGVRRMARE